MSFQDSEGDRLRRLREKQIRARDPLAKQRRVEGAVARRRRASVKRFSLGELRKIPHKWMWMTAGLVVGVIVLIVLPSLWGNKYADIVGLVAILLLAVVGYFFGQALDARDELRDLTRD
jgi:uncharacterized membrane protein